MISNRQDVCSWLFGSFGIAILSISFWIGAAGSTFADADPPCAKVGNDCQGSCPAGQSCNATPIDSCICE
jgi:hypothetical protein